MTQATTCRTFDANEAIRIFPSFMNEAIASSFKALMETKGLYQSVPIDRASALQQVRDRTLPAFVNEFERLLRRGYPERGGLTLADSDLYLAGTQQQLLVLRPVNVKLFCAKCDRDEAFKPLWSQEITNEISKPSAGKGNAAREFPVDFQIFSLVYQCQSCLGLPEIFLIKRAGQKIAIQGRSPIQSVAVPTYIPKEEAKWYRESLIARNAGRTLAAIFYLRTFIEQFARRVTQIQDRRSGEEILSEYNTTIPEPPRSSMPSLKQCYEKLSEAIHTANENADLLKSTIEDVDTHFDFRRVYRMLEVVPNGAPERETKENLEDKDENSTVASAGAPVEPESV